MSSGKNKLGSPEPSVGKGKPPAKNQFKPGVSGNPGGRPKGAKGRRATAKRVLLEKHNADPHRTGKAKQYSAIELVLIILKKLAASGDQRAFKAFTDLERRFGPVDAEQQKVGYIVVPEALTREEWEAKYAPKDIPPGDGEIFD